jgi:hypothetical protein
MLPQDLRSMKHWSEEELTFLRDNYRKKSYAEIASHLCRPVTAVKSKAGAMGIQISRRWSDEDTVLLKELYPDTPTKEIAERLGRCLTKVYRMANSLGLKKSEAFLASEASGRMNKWNRIRRGLDHRFPKGSTPWNKGKKIGSHPNAAKTQFKKGHLPHNHQPVGTIVVVDGYKKIKLAEPNVWEHLHRKIWMDHHGEIPEGQCVVFKDGDSLKCEIENLELITREELMQRNTLHNYPEPLKAAIHQLAGMRRRINSYAKKQDRGSQEHSV